MANKLQGKRVLVAVRKLSEQATKDAYILPLQTSGDFDLSRDTDTTTTKDGIVSTSGALELDFSVELIDSDDVVLDLLEDSLINETMLEVWRIKFDKKDSQGRAFAHYMHAKVTEDSQSADADDIATREFTFTNEGDPKRGYLVLPTNIQEAIDYAFKGLEDTTTNATGNGVASSETNTPQATSNSNSNSQVQE